MERFRQVCQCQRKTWGVFFRDTPSRLTCNSTMAYPSRRRWHTLQRPARELHFGFGPEDSVVASHGNFHNGYSHHSSLSLLALDCRAQLARSGHQSYQTEPRSMTWGKYKGYNSTSERESLRECSFVESLGQTQTPLPSRKCGLELPTRFKGQRNCGLPVCVVEQQCPSVLESPASGWTQAKQQNTSDQHHRLKNSWKPSPKPCSEDSNTHSFLKSTRHVAKDVDGPMSRREAIFSTEVPQNFGLNGPQSEKGILQNVERDLKNGGQDLRGESYVFSSKKTQRLLRDQISRVVVNLEEVLRGLKEVHLEMKEVVQQIDQLTSDIDLEEEEEEEEDCIKDASGRCGTGRVVVVMEENKEKDAGTDLGNLDTLEHPNHPLPTQTKAGKDTKVQKTSGKVQRGGKNTPTCPPPAYPTGPMGKNKLMPNSKRDPGESQSKTPKPEEVTLSGPRSQKPPPYPYSSSSISRAGRTNKGKDPGLKTPPYCGKRRLLSTTV